MNEPWPEPLDIWLATGLQKKIDHKFVENIMKYGGQVERSDGDWLAIITEEVGEIAEEIVIEMNRDKSDRFWVHRQRLEEELVDTITACMGMLMTIDSQCTERKKQHDRSNEERTGERTDIGEGDDPEPPGAA